MKNGLLIAAAISALPSLAGAATVTGDPSSDTGWNLTGNSLANGVYVDGSANYSFSVYSTGFAIESGSSLEISDGTLSWLAGDTVLGVGGQFESITAAEAGWAAFTGGSVNSLLGSTGPKLQVKFGTSDATWSTSTVAPGAGNGSGSSSLGGGRVQVRTSGFFSPVTPSSGEGYTWDANSGQLLILDKQEHIDWDGVATQPDRNVARMIWNWDEGAQHVDSWELLLNVSLLQRLEPGGSDGLFPSIGDQAIVTVQNGDSAYTNALVTVPEPAAIGLIGMGAAAMLLRRRRA